MDYIMTEEERQGLLGLMPFSQSATLEYIPEPYKAKKEDGSYYVSEELWPRFSLRAMTRKEIDTLRKTVVMKKTEDQIAFMSEAVANVVVGWANVLDIGTNPPTEVPYEVDEKGGCNRELFKAAVTVPVMQDMATMILRMNGIAGPDRLGLGS